jgi:hypothetical protein
MIKNLDRWSGSYFKGEVKKLFSKPFKQKKRHVIFCSVDHYEPDWNGASQEQQTERVKAWAQKYPKLAEKHSDSDGVHPKHTFFYPAEIYNEQNLSYIKEICQQGFGEVEIHLHHDNDTEDSLKKQLSEAKKKFCKQGFLGRRKLSHQPHFCFIHGNWALNNSHDDGKWCGVNNETKVLSDLGCYADFTYPSAPHHTQPKKINSIYYTKSSTENPKTHNKGTDVQVGKFTDGDLLMIQGPLTLNWKNRKKGIFPAIENGDITGANPPQKDRIDLWVKQNISVIGREDWTFVKVHTHGAPEKNAEMLLGKPMDEMYSYLEDKYNDGENFILHYVTAREMYNIVKAAEAGEKGSPADYRDYIIEKNKNESGI